MATECQDCGHPENHEENRIVGHTGPYGPVCNECWAIFLSQETVITRREADVVALKEMDGHRSHNQIGELLGLEKSTVDTLWQRAREKIITANRTRDELGHLVEG